MHSTNDSPEPTLEAPLIDRIRRALSHDLRTPLGTIANYAAILEYHGTEKPEDVRVFAARIRASANRTVAMLEEIHHALVLSRRPLSTAGLDPAVILRALLSELSIHVRFPAHGEEPQERVPFDPDLVTFAWRAFLSVNLEAARSGALDIDLMVELGDALLSLDMYVGARTEKESERVGSTRWTRDMTDVLPVESCFALGLAEDLIHMRGGELKLWGRPGLPSGLRISFPAPL